ncbi:hypothetical protein D3218_13040 [Aureimonas flava]|uniref:Uncharacterized protein n=1 Tax=Aureimonas flava TaxID=2320271 RepID=A0A3A1WSA1_9HYPH|nr:hypothetical protein [Aureimonas flava]RIY00205.1 hypothetical protein D3218_13040 [Aureimonas flava]
MAGSQLDEIEALLRANLKATQDVKLRLHDIDLRLRLIEEGAKGHHHAMFEWCAPAALRAEVDRFADVQHVPTPPGLKTALEMFLKKSGG